MHRFAPLLILSAFGCKEPAQKPAENPATKSAPAVEPKVAAAKKKTKGAAKALGGTLKKRVLSAIAEGGPAKAVDACAGEAQAITEKLVAEHGVKMGRSSLRLRNPDNRGPGWVRAWLTEHGERSAKGLQPSMQVTTSTSGKVVRFIKPIPIEPLCLSCHGTPEKIDPAVKKLLAERYPEDAATGYEDGALRGVLWAEGPVE